ncbi:hypothetical protein [Kangiella sp.]|uniref:hypothetical protein n=1 Tax=Kangiella sp. TaxID=1920245 RepID=UPI003A8E1796
MSVNNGDNASAPVFNSAFLSKIAGGSIQGAISLVQTGMTAVYDLQEWLLDLADRVTDNETDIASNTTAIANVPLGYTPTSQNAIADDGTVNLGNNKLSVVSVAGDGAAITLNSIPFGAGYDSLSDMTVIRLYGTHATNTVTIVENDNDGGAILNGESVTLSKGRFIEFLYDKTNKRFVEVMRSADI